MSDMRATKLMKAAVPETNIMSNMSVRTIINRAQLHIKIATQITKLDTICPLARQVQQEFLLKSSNAVFSIRI